MYRCLGHRITHLYIEERCYQETAIYLHISHWQSSDKD